MADTENNKNSNSPALRFPGFTDPWSKFALGDLGTSLIGLTYSPKDVVQEDGIIVLRSSNIQDGALDFNDIVRVSKKIRPALFTQEDDILICSRNGSARLIGKNAIIPKSLSGLTFGAFMMVYRSNQNRFIHHQLNTKRYQAQVSENLGARINQITSSDLNSFEFFFPCEREQNKIAEFIDLIDERIATQRRLIEDFISLRSAILQDAIKKGLSKKSWKFTTLTEILTERGERNYNGYDVCSVSVSEGVVNQIEYLGRSFAAKETGHYNVARYGDIIYTKSPTGSFPYGIVKRNTQKEPAAISPLYGVFVPIHDWMGMLLEYYFESEVNTFNYLHPIIQKGAKNTINITNSGFLANSVPLPTSESEALTLAKCLDTITHKIVLEKSVLANYTVQREYFLSKMFV
ncbi:restriction endonuclease subunit S [Barnesiella sp. WM24]|uniref:restriction endonuclease subunit S n=1 Tax=Barnesiella sp. WM24 TaxID=2558278 RepID=UPI001071F57A|nr:restriction endonuclease subunit S [Barnesiella sp. WM24]TFU95090.1 restriction endonuclease subunit S [Barnesiella sp. WM24]